MTGATARWLVAARNGRAAPPPPAARLVTDREIHDSSALFTARILGWHYTRDGQAAQPVCNCGWLANLCPYLRAAHEILGHPLSGRPRPLPYPRHGAA